MVWFRVDDGFHSHPKLAGVSFAARGLWVTAGSWSGQHLTDGDVPAKMLRAWNAPTKLADELVDAGLWVRTESGFAFHEWAHHQPGRAVVEKQRAEARERVAKFRDAKRARNAVTTDDGNAGVTRYTNVAPPECNAPPDPTRPDPSRPDHNQSGGGGAADEESKTAAAGARWLSDVTGFEPWNCHGKWAKSLRRIAAAPDEQKRKVAATLQAWPDKTARKLTPDHVADYWHDYVAGKRPTDREQSSPRAEPPKPPYHQEFSE